MNRAAMRILRGCAANDSTLNAPMDAYRRVAAAIVLMALKDLDGSHGEIERWKSAVFFESSEWAEQLFDFLGLSKEAVRETVAKHIEERSDAY